MVQQQWYKVSQNSENTSFIPYKRIHNVSKDVFIPVLNCENEISITEACIEDFVFSHSLTNHTSRDPMTEEKIISMSQSWKPLGNVFINLNNSSKVLIESLAIWSSSC